jgi:glucitol operon activator protein
MHSTLLILGAVVAGWAVQLYLSYQQSRAFNDQVRRLRTSGTVSVGSGGRRYRGGRAFVAIAVDEHNIVRDALVLSGFTTFARARPVPALFDLKLNAVGGERSIPQLSRQQREAARQAALLFKQGRDTLASV